VIVVSLCGRKDLIDCHLLSIASLGLNLIHFFGMLIVGVAKVPSRMSRY